MAEEKIIVAGFGGQGVMAVGQILTYAGMIEGKHVAWVPSFGPEMRGGTANCNVIISSSEIGAPTISKAEAVIVFNEASYDKFESDVVEGGALIVNSSMTEKKSDRTDINAYYVPANEIALSLGNERTLNMVMLGAYLEARGILEMESVRQGFLEVFGEHRAHLWDVNLDAINKGAEVVKNS